MQSEEQVRELTRKARNEVNDFRQPVARESDELASRVAQISAEESNNNAKSYYTDARLAPPSLPPGLTWYH